MVIKMGRLISEYLHEEDNLAGLLITNWDFPFSPSFAMKGRERALAREEPSVLSSSKDISGHCQSVLSHSKI